jgi:hypothetical protein
MIGFLRGIFKGCARVREETIRVPQGLPVHRYTMNWAGTVKKRKFRHSVTGRSNRLSTGFAIRRDLLRNKTGLKSLPDMEASQG